MLLLDLLRRRMPGTITVLVLLATPLWAQNFPSPRPTAPNRYPPATPNQYTPATPNQYTPVMPNRYTATPRPQPQQAYPRQATPGVTPLRMAQVQQSPQQAAAPQLIAAEGNEHPLAPTVRWARSGLENLEKVQDYSATMVKRERINGKLADTEYMFVKIRHKPLSVYMYFLGPPKLKGQEVIYIDGANNGNMWAHGTGLEAMFGTISLPPSGMIAMRGQRYPITEIGLLNLTRRLLAIAEQDSKYGECEVTFYKGAKINDRVCTCVEVIHPVPRRNFLFHVARIFVDDELNIPIRYEAYDWPKTQGGAPELIEQYTYLNLKLNNGFTDADFDVRNPNYAFE